MERLARITGINTETGVFKMVLATEGEATDGDILNIKGGRIPAQMPLMNSHANDVREIMGSVTQPNKDLKALPPVLNTTGNIEMEGEGEQLAFRRDLAHMIDKGHIKGVSIRWNPIKFVPRVNLPADHPHFVDATNASGPELWGRYHEKWEALEGSIVALGADPAALIAHAEECEGDQRAYWCAMADEAEQYQRDSDIVANAPRLDQLSLMASDLRSRGVDLTSIINAVSLEGDGRDFELVDIGGESVTLPKRLADQLAAEREDQSTIVDAPVADPPRTEDADPRPRNSHASLKDVLTLIRDEREARAKTTEGLVRRVIAEAQGRV